MILVDRDLSKRIEDEGLFQKETYDIGRVTNIGYDLRTKAFYDDAGAQTEKVLSPGESVMVAAQEIVQMPSNLAAVVHDRNSRIRQGLSVSAPIYQPGHTTRVFYRLTNFSEYAIQLSTEESYAMILFEELSGSAAKQYKGTFKDEIGDYTGLSGYEKAYEKQIKQIDKKADNVREIEKSIYANVLAILAVFVAIFSLISTNVKLLENESTIRSFIGYNLITIGGISFLLTLLRTTILNDLSKKKPVKGIAYWVPTILVFVAALIVFLIVK